MRTIIRLCLVLVVVTIFLGYRVADGDPATTNPAQVLSAATAPGAVDNATTQPTSAPATIQWDQAKDFIGKEATVTGPVVGTHDLSGGAVVLNIGKDYPDPGRFTIYISKDKRKDVPDDLYEGKTISATGKIKLYHHVAEIEGDATDIVAVAQPATAPTSQP